MSERAPDTSQFRVALLAPRGSILGRGPCGGSEVVLREDRAILESAGARVVVYAQAAAPDAGIEQIPSRSNLPLLGSLEYCGRFVRREPVALLVGYNEPTVAALAPDRSIIRFDWTTPLPRYWNLPFWLGRFQRSLYLFPSESERKNFLASHARIPAGRTVVVPNAVDTTLFAPQNRVIPAPRVGFAGQWAERKGIGTLLEAWEIVHQCRPEAELWMAGGVSLWKAKNGVSGAAEIQARVRSAEGKNIRLLGELARREMPGFWNSLAVAVVPSLCEPFGLVALEALSCGVPVVASRVGGLPEIVVEGQCGLLVPPGAPNELAHALLMLLDDESLRGRFSQAARERGKEFSIERRAKHLLRLFENHVNEARGRVAVSPAGGFGG